VHNHLSTESQISNPGPDTIPKKSESKCKCKCPYAKTDPDLPAEFLWAWAFIGVAFGGIVLVNNIREGKTIWPLRRKQAVSQQCIALSHMLDEKCDLVKQARQEWDAEHENERRASSPILQITKWA
jgi:hypothetical protein